MQQLSMSRVCKIGDHEQKPIEFVCIFPECTLSRFLCNKCLRSGIHKHQQQESSHILDHNELHDIIKEKIKNKQRGIGNDEDWKFILWEMKNLLSCMQNLIELMSQDIQSCSDRYLNEQLIELKCNGFNQLEDKQLNTLINIDKQVGEIYAIITSQSNYLIQNVIRIQERCNSQQMENKTLLQKIKDAKLDLITQDYVDDESKINAVAISNDLKYIASGGTDKQLQIWNYDNKALVKKISLDNQIYKIQFTDDSKLLYVGSHQYLYQFDLYDNMRETYKQIIHQQAIWNIYCITSNIILTTSSDKNIIKTDINLKQQLLLIQAHTERINGLDYNRKLNILASSSYDKSIKLWNANNGILMLEKKNAHNNNCTQIYQVLFIITKIQLISLDTMKNVIIWNINFDSKQLEQFKLITEANNIYNMSLVLDEQCITLICNEYIKIFSIKLDYIRSIKHEVNEFLNFNTNQPQSMKALLIKGQQMLQICQVKLN